MLVLIIAVTVTLTLQHNANHTLGMYICADLCSAYRNQCHV